MRKGTRETRLPAPSPQVQERVDGDGDRDETWKDQERKNTRRHATRSGSLHYCVRTNSSNEHCIVGHVAHRKNRQGCPRGLQEMVCCFSILVQMELLTRGLMRHYPSTSCNLKLGQWSDFDVDHDVLFVSCRFFVCSTVNLCFGFCCSAARPTPRGTSNKQQSMEMEREDYCR